MLSRYRIMIVSVASVQKTIYQAVPAYLVDDRRDCSWRANDEGSEAVTAELAWQSARMTP